MTVQQLIDTLEQYPDKRRRVMTADGYEITEVGTVVADALPASLTRQDDEWLEYKQCVLIEDFRPFPFWKIPPLIQGRMLRDSWCRLSLWEKIMVLLGHMDLLVVHEDLRIKGIKAIYQQEYRERKQKEYDRGGIRRVADESAPGTEEAEGQYLTQEEKTKAEG